MESPPEREREAGMTEAKEGSEERSGVGFGLSGWLEVVGRGEREPPGPLTPGLPVILLSVAPGRDQPRSLAPAFSGLGAPFWPRAPRGLLLCSAGLRVRSAPGPPGSQLCRAGRSGAWAPKGPGDSCFVSLRLT